MDMTRALTHHGADGYAFDLLSNPLKEDPGVDAVFIRHPVADFDTWRPYYHEDVHRRDTADVCLQTDRAAQGEERFLPGLAVSD